MASNAHIEQIEQFVQTILEGETEYFCVQIKIKPTNNIKVFLDGDNGLPIEKCTRFNRALYKLIEDANLFPTGDFSLEVSSPGLTEPFKLHRQYVKNIGRAIEIIFNDATTQEGTLLEVTETDILIETTSGKGKKAITQQLLVPFSNIKSTTVQIKF